MAQAICDCTTPLLDLNKQAAQAPDQIDFEGIQIAFEQARVCIAEQRMKPEDLAEVEKALAVKCPALSSEKELWAELLGKN